MQHSKAPNEPLQTYRSATAAVIGLIFLMIVATAPAQDPSSEYSEYTQSQLLDEILHLNHDELIMLILSLVVIVQIAVVYKWIRTIPFNSLLLCSFGCVVLSAVCTVAEGFMLTEALNYVEHASVAAASILLAVWCGRTFAFNKPEDG